MVIDPGVEAFGVVESQLAKLNVGLAGVIATHGHVDHIASAAKLANKYQVKMWMHPDDDFMLTDAVAGLGSLSRPMLEEMGVATLDAPEQRGFLADGQSLELGGITFEIWHLPGHSPGSVNLLTRLSKGSILFTGDVLFAGSIGRTDLPGGDPALMRNSLRRLVELAPADAQCAPGHGSTTSMERELATNPYLNGSAVF